MNRGRAPWQRTAGWCGYLGVMVMGCWVMPLPHGYAQQEEDVMPFTLTSSAFRDGAQVPKRYTCTGKDVSPPLAWTDPPHGTESFALISGDPDAPLRTWVHWVLYNLPADARALAEGVRRDAQLENGAGQGVNDFQLIGYGGPCPPRGPVHHYSFTLYALDTRLTLPPRATKAQVDGAMEGHILTSARLVGLYQR